MVSSWISQMHFIHFTSRLANGQWSFRFCLPPQIFFLRSIGFLDHFVWKYLWGTIYRGYFSFRDLVIRSCGLLQVPYQLLFQKSIIWLYAIVIPLYKVYDVTFCVWSLYFVYRKNKLTKQTLDWLKDLSKHS